MSKKAAKAEKAIVAQAAQAIAAVKAAEKPKANAPKRGPNNEMTLKANPVLNATKVGRNDGNGKTAGQSGRMPTKVTQWYTGEVGRLLSGVAYTAGQNILCPRSSAPNTVGKVDLSPRKIGLRKLMLDSLSWSRYRYKEIRIRVVGGAGYDQPGLIRAFVVPNPNETIVFSPELPAAASEMGEMTYLLKVNDTEGWKPPMPPEPMPLFLEDPPATSAQDTDETLTSPGDLYIIAANTVPLAAAGYGIVEVDVLVEFSARYDNTDVIATGATTFSADLGGNTAGTSATISFGSSMTEQDTSYVYSNMPWAYDGTTGYLYLYGLDVGEVIDVSIEVLRNWSVAGSIQAVASWLLTVGTSFTILDSHTSITGTGAISAMATAILRIVTLSYDLVNQQPFFGWNPAPTNGTSTVQGVAEFVVNVLPGFLQATATGYKLMPPTMAQLHQRGMRLRKLFGHKLKVLPHFTHWGPTGAWERDCPRKAPAPPAIEPRAEPSPALPAVTSTQVTPFPCGHSAPVAECHTRACWPAPK